MQNPYESAAESFCANFLAIWQLSGGKDFNGLACNLRFDDINRTNPTKEEQEYIDSIMDFLDVKWLGFDWEDRLYFSSDYFEKHDFMSLPDILPVTFD